MIPTNKFSKNKKPKVTLFPENITTQKVVEALWNQSCNGPKEKTPETFLRREKCGVVCRWEESDGQNLFHGGNSLTMNNESTEIEIGKPWIFVRLDMEKLSIFHYTESSNRQPSHQLIWLSVIMKRFKATFTLFHLEFHTIHFLLHNSIYLNQLDITIY